MALAPKTETLPAARTTAGDHWLPLAPGVRIESGRSPARASHNGSHTEARQHPKHETEPEPNEAVG